MTNIAAHERRGVSARDAESVTRTMSELRVSDLRSELDKRGLDKTGLKAALSNRHSQAMQNEGENTDTYQFTVQVESPIDNLRVCKDSSSKHRR
ncbi:hypothetical protein MRX96_002901 [Rhipicephalus microplus]